MARATRTSKRACRAKTKKGTRCTRNPLDGEDYCIAHAPEDVKASRGFGGPQPGSGRPPTPRAVDVLRERIEQDIEKVIGPLWEALEAEAGIALNVKGGGMTIEMIPDHLTRLRAVRELLDRGYGRPKQATEITTPEGGIVLVAPADATAKSRKAAELLKGLDQVDAAG